MSNRQSSRIGIIGHTLPAMVALAVGLGAAASATVLNVDGSAGCSDVTGTPYCTIQAALNAAANGDTLSVAAGTYNESPNVTKSVVVQSVSGRDATFINLQTGPTYLGSLTIGGANVTVDGFTIVGFDAVGNGLASTNILLNAGLGTVVVSNNRLQVGNPGVGSNGDDGMGLLTTYDETNITASLSVTGTVFEPVNSAAGRAFFINVGVNNFTFSQNSITGAFNGRALTQAQNGLVDQNTVSGTGAAGSRSAGLGTWGYPDPTVWGHTTFQNNAISGTAKGISIIETNAVTVRNNFFTQNTNAVWVGEAVPVAFDVTTISVRQNSFANSDNEALLNTKSATLSAVANWWNAASGPSQATNSGGSGDAASAAVDYSPWLSSGTDAAAAAGFQVAVPTAYGVNPNNPPAYTTGGLQDGVNFAAGGDTIDAAAGTYVEQVTVGKSLTIAGAGAGSSIVQAPAALVGDANGSKNIVTLTGGGVSVELRGFTVTGPGPSGCGSIDTGVFVRNGASANIHDDAIADIRDQPLSGCQNGSGIRVGRSGFSTTGTATIMNNVISGYQKGGIVVDGVGSSATITGNAVSGVGATPLIAQNGIQISRGAVGSLTGNSVTGNECDHSSCGSDPVADTQSVGVLLFQAGAGTAVSNNPDIGGNDIGVYNLSVGSSISGNTIASNRYEGIVLDDGSASVTANEISGGNIGVAALSFSGNVGNSAATLSCNRIADAGVGIELIDDDTLDSVIPVVTANDNAITGNGVGVDNTTSALTDATQNWWGCAAGPGASGCDTVSGNVDFTPFAASVPACVSCNSNADCDDGLACNGAETCVISSHTCAAGTPPCTLGSADPQCNVALCAEPGLCSVDPLADGSACNTGDTCAAGVCTGPSTLVLSSASLHIATAPRFTNGRARVAAFVNDNDTGGTLHARLLAGTVTLEVQEGANFHVTVPIGGCHAIGTKGTVQCKAGTVTARFRQVPGPFVYRMTVTATKLTSAVTGVSPPTGPIVLVTLHQGPVDRIDDISLCRQRGHTMLVCRDP